MHEELRAFLFRSGLVQHGAPVTCTTLSGGVSCDVWRIDTPERSFCVKRALPRLRVEALWEAPVSRNAAEWAWMEFAARIAPQAVPHLLAQDPDHAMFAMEYLEPERFPVWKTLLLNGLADAEFAASVAVLLARLHAASAGDQDIALRFDTRDAFNALRIEPYLIESARRNPRVAGPLRRLADETLATGIALVHGDVSPKNILAGPDGPVFLDAETAWYGDPAFDVAFCLNHLLLKCLARPAHRKTYLDGFTAFAATYLSAVSWEATGDVERRAAHLLPALLLARVDGKSPVEYLSESDELFVRDFACALLREPQRSLDQIAQMWRTAVTRRRPAA
jgi:5-methylthioribose kinase